MERSDYYTNDEADYDAMVEEDEQDTEAVRAADAAANRIGEAILAARSADVPALREQHRAAIRAAQRAREQRIEHRAARGLTAGA